MQLENFTIDIFKNAVKTYLEVAYPDGITLKDFGYKSVSSILNAKTIEEIFQTFKKFDITNQQLCEDDQDESEECTRCKFVAQLGSKNYPFLKFNLQQCEGTYEFGFLVDRHTEFLALHSKSETFSKEKEIKDYTRDLKLIIENMLEEKKIPTYRALIRDLVKIKMEQKETIQVAHKKTHILLVEDDKEIRDLHQIELEMQGYTVTSATSGEQGIQLANNEYFDLMLLDLMMPKMSGFEVIEFVGNEIPIIVLTALSDNLSRKRCLDSGAKEMVTKPADFNELAKVIDKYVKEKMK